MDKEIILPHELKPEYRNHVWGASWELFIVIGLVLAIAAGTYLVLV